VIRLHRLSARAEAFYLNPDLIVAIDSTPDTVVTLTTHQKVLVADSAETVVAAVQDWRVSILANAFPNTTRRSAARSDANLSLVTATIGTQPTNPESEGGDR
jgi:flagellar protein FlbD